MEFTGERVIPGRTDPDLFNEHVARYRFAEGLVGGRVVLDAGCGAGYGTAILARKASLVYALDIAREAVVQGREETAGAGAANARFVEGSCSRLPFRDASLDAVVAFEVIEHLEDWRGLLSEARRVLRPDGQLLVSTPNRLYYGESRREPNPYHVHEFDYAEFRAELEAVFPYTAIFLQNHAEAIAFTPERPAGLRTAAESNRAAAPDEAHFFLAVCSGQPQFGSPAFLYVPATGNVLRERERHIRLLEDETARKTAWLDEAKASLEKLARINADEQRKAQEAIERLEAEIAEKNAWGERLQAELDEKTAWSLQLDEERRRLLENYANLEATAEERLSQLRTAIAKIDELEARVAERTAWAQSLDAELQRERARLAAARETLAELYASPAYRIGRRLRLAPQPRG